MGQFQDIPNFVVSELRSSSEIVNLFLTDDRQTLNVLRCYGVEQYSWDGSWDGDASPKLTGRFRFGNKIVAARAMRNRISGKFHYLVLLEEADAIIVQIRNDLFELEDEVEFKSKFGKPDRVLSEIICYDERFNRHFMCVEDGRVVKINLDTTTTIRFNPKAPFSVVFETCHEIVNFEVCWHMDNSLGECMSMAIITRHRTNTHYRINFIQELNPATDKWRVAGGEEMHLDLGQGSWDSPKILGLSSCGYLFISPVKVGFLGLEDAGDGFGLKVTKWRESSGPCIFEQNPNLQILGNPIVTKSQEETLMHIFTNYGHIFSSSLGNLILKLNDDSRSFDVGFVSPNVNKFGPKAIQFVDYAFPLQNNLVILTTLTSGMVLLNLDSKLTRTLLPFEKFSIFDSTTVGVDSASRKLVLCGGSHANRGFLEVTQLEFRGKVHVKRIRRLETGGARICHAWFRDNSIFWTDDNAHLFKDEMLVDAAGRETIFVTAGRTIIHTDEKIAYAQIHAFHGESFVYATDKGQICWTDDLKSLWVPGFKKNEEAIYTISASILKSNSILTVLAWRSHCVWVTGSKLTMSKVNKIEEIADCLVKRGASFEGVVFTGKAGEFLTYSTEGTMLHFLNLCNHPLRVVDIPGSDFVITYCKEVAFLLKLVSNTGVGLAELSIPFAVRHLCHRGVTTFHAISFDNDVFEIDLRELLLDDMRITSKKIVCRTHSLTDVISFESSRRYILALALASNFDNKTNRTITNTQIHCYDIIKGELVSSCDISKDFPQALVSSITKVPVQKMLLSAQYIDNETSYAKQLILGRCFLLSLNYELADDERLDNLLLFTLDDLNGEIELQLTFNTQFSVTCLSGYYNRIIFASGERLQAFQLDYSVKENEFRLLPVSNAMMPFHGFPKRHFAIPCLHKAFTALKPSKKQKTEASSLTQVLGVFDVSKGLQFYSVDVSSVIQKKTELMTSVLQSVSLSPVKASFQLDYSALVRDLDFMCDMFFQDCGGHVDKNAEDLHLESKFAAIGLRNTIAVAYKLCSHPGSSSDHTKSTVQGSSSAIMKLPYHANGLSSVETRSDTNTSVNENALPYAKSFNPLFVVHTAEGFAFLVSTIVNQQVFEEYAVAWEKTTNVKPRFTADFEQDSEEARIFDEKLLKRSHALESLL